MQSHESRQLLNASALALTCYFYSSLPHWLSIPLVAVLLFNVLSSIHPSPVATTFKPVYSPLKIARKSLSTPTSPSTSLPAVQQRSPLLSPPRGVGSEGGEKQQQRSTSPPPRYYSPQTPAGGKPPSSSLPVTPFQRSHGTMGGNQRRSTVASAQKATPVSVSTAAASGTATQSPSSKLQQWISKSESSSPTTRLTQPQTTEQIRKMVGEEVQKQQRIQQQQEQLHLQQPQPTTTISAGQQRPEISIKTFQPASKSPAQRKFIQSSPITQVSSGSGGSGVNLITRSFEDYMSAYGLDDAALLKSARVFRQWFQDKIIGPLLDQYSAAISEISTLQRNQQQPSAAMAMRTFSSVGVNQQQQQSSNLQQLVADVESFFTVERVPASKEYVLHRLQQLRASPELGQYDWNHGSSYQGRPFNASTNPTDAEILFHLFCRYLDFKLSQLGSHRTAKPFTAAYVVLVDPEAQHGITDSLTLPVPPSSNLRLFVSRGQHLGSLQVSLLLNRTVYDVYHGRSNLFYALISFLVYWNQKSAGWIEMLSLAGDLELGAIMDVK